MNLDFIEIPSGTSKPKATIHVTGKLGFNMEAVKYMNIGDGTYFRIARNRDAADKKDLYFVPADENAQGAVKVAKAGQYYYMNLGALFTQMNLEYDKRTIAFDISKTDYNGTDIYLLTKRRKETPREKKEEQPQNE